MLPVQQHPSYFLHVLTLRLDTEWQFGIVEQP